MKTMVTGIVLLLVGIGVVPVPQAGTRRTDLQRHDLSVPGGEVVQVRVDFDPGYVAPRHTHFDILQKLEASDRTEAVTIGLTRGIIHLP